MKAPTPQEHIRHFLPTVDDYIEMADLQPFPEVVQTDEHDPAQRLALVLHAMMLRKYFSKADELFLPKVVDSLEELGAADNYEAAVWVSFRDQVAQVPDFIGFQHDNGPTWGEGDLLLQQLYGRYLHGDYEKWLITQRMSHSMAMLGLYWAVHERRRTALGLATFARYLGHVKGTGANPGGVGSKLPSDYLEGMTGIEPA